jgi:hypothetical protein
MIALWYGLSPQRKTHGKDSTIALGNGKETIISNYIPDYGKSAFFCSM